MRRTYADASSPTYITGLNTTALNPLQLNSSVDGAGEGGVIFDSALAFCKFRDVVLLGDSR